MDEGFTTYVQNVVTNEMAVKKVENPFKQNYVAYANLVNTGKEQPQTTHADRYDENRPYSISSYIKGSIFLSQLGYLIGQDNLAKTIKRYYQEFKFKHPTPNDIKRTAERVSGAELDWYLTDWTQTTNTIDYGITAVKDNDENTMVSLERIGRMPMPIDLQVEYVDGTVESFYIPLRMLFFVKENPNPEIKRTVLSDWAWANPKYELRIEKPKSAIKKITIDPSSLMADVKLDNNAFEVK
ncbi:MAG: peptidase M1, partial [Flavobacteriales bacterium 32-34-25]